MSHAGAPDPVLDRQPRVDRSVSPKRGVVHSEVAATIHSSPDRLAALYMDYEHWPRLFPATIAGVRVLEKSEDRIVVEVNHRTSGPVVNIIRPRSPREIELEEHKPKFDATFINRFEQVGNGSRYVVTADVRLKPPFGMLAPFLGWYVRRTIKRFVLEPMRVFAEERTSG